MAQVLSQNEVDALLNQMKEEYIKAKTGLLIKQGYSFTNTSIRPEDTYAEEFTSLIIKSNDKHKTEPFVKNYNHIHNSIKKIVIEGQEGIYFSKDYIEKIRHIFPLANILFKNSNVIIDWKEETLVFLNSNIYSNQMILYKGTGNTLFGKGAFKKHNNTIDKNIWTNQSISLMRLKYEIND